MIKILKILTCCLSIVSCVCAAEALPTSDVRNNEPIHMQPVSSQSMMQRRNTDSTDLSRYFDRDSYIRTQIEQLIEQEKEIKQSIQRTQVCANIWTVAAAVTTTIILTFSVIGATDYIDPKIANVISSCGAGLNGLFMWISMQYKKTERIEFDKHKKIREALGVPSRLVINDMSTSFEQFRSP